MGLPKSHFPDLASMEIYHRFPGGHGFGKAQCTVFPGYFPTQSMHASGPAFNDEAPLDALQSSGPFIRFPTPFDHGKVSQKHRSPCCRLLLTHRQL